MKNITVDTFNFVDTNYLISIPNNDESINRRFKKIQECVEKGNAYIICRSEYDYFMRMRTLEQEVETLRKQNKELIEKNKKLDKELNNPVTEYHSNEYYSNEPWIDNGHPGNDWRKIHEMGSL